MAPMSDSHHQTGFIRNANPQAPSKCIDTESLGQCDNLRFNKLCRRTWHMPKFKNHWSIAMVHNLLWWSECLHECLDFFQAYQISLSLKQGKSFANYFEKKKKKVNLMHSKVWEILTCSTFWSLFAVNYKFFILWHSVYSSWHFYHSFSHSYILKSN